MAGFVHMMLPKIGLKQPGIF